MLPVKQWQKNEEMMEIYLDNKSFDLIKSGFYFKVVWNPWFLFQSRLESINRLLSVGR